MSATFTLTIDLSAKEMQTGEGIAGALHRAANKLSENYGIDYVDEWVGLGSAVTDSDRTRVGSWRIDNRPTSEEVARQVLAANLADEASADAADAALRHVEFGGDRVRIMLVTAASVARGEAA